MNLFGEEPGFNGYLGNHGKCGAWTPHTNPGLSFFGWPAAAGDRIGHVDTITGVAFDRGHRSDRRDRPGRRHHQRPRRDANVNAVGGAPLARVTTADSRAD